MAADDKQLSEGPRGFWKTVGHYLKYEWHTPLAIVGGALSPSARLLPGKWDGSVLVVGVVMLVAAGIGAVVNRKRVSHLEEKLGQAEEDLDAARGDLTKVSQVSKSVYRSLLVNLAAALKLTAEERISIYLHDPGLPSFQLLCRHSSDPSLEVAPGRGVYPDTEGIIGMAWRQGWAVENGLPDPVGGGDYAAENYRRFGLPTAVSEGFAMKSRALAGLRYPSDAMGDTYIGVLVIESVNPDWDTSALLPQIEGSDWWFTLVEHLRARRQHLPLLSYAEEKGF